MADDVDLSWMIGPSMAENFTRHGLPAPLHEAAVAAYRTRHTETGLYEADLLPGATDLLDRLVGADVPVALATAKPVNEAALTLAHFGIADRFAVVAGEVPGGPTHGKTTIVADALARLGAPARPVMIGDRRHDIDAGRLNGCTTIAVTWGYAEPGEFDACAPDHRVASFDELAALLLADRP